MSKPNLLGEHVTFEFTTDDGELIIQRGFVVAELEPDQFMVRAASGPWVVARHEITATERTPQGWAFVETSVES